MSHADQPNSSPARAFGPLRRIVIKVGSAVIAPSGLLEPAAIDRLAGDVASAIAAGRQIVIVTSGAIASGFRQLGLDAMPKTIIQKQAAAAVGQPRLMQAWAEAFQRRSIPVAQVLLTGEDIAIRSRFLNARATLLELLARHVVPIINENDSVSFEEIKLGDNDRLSALTAQLIHADALLILSTVEGLWDSGKRAAIVDQVDDIDDAARHVRAEKSATGVGGMATKLAAAQIAGAAGAHAFIAGGSVANVVARVLAGEHLGTYFLPRSRRAGARRRWIAHGAKPRGLVVVDAGAADAIIAKGASLLPRGIVDVQGPFDRGAAIEIADESQRVIAKGLSAYSSDEIARIMGKRSSSIAATLGYAYCDEVIHRDDMDIRASGGRHEA